MAIPKRPRKNETKPAEEMSLLERLEFAIHIEDTKLPAPSNWDERRWLYYRRMEKHDPAALEIYEAHWGETFEEVKQRAASFITAYLEAEDQVNDILGPLFK